MLRLDGKIAFISGMGSVGEGWGNGRATAVVMARQGATVFGTDVNLAAAENTVATIHAEGGLAAAVRCDMTDGEDVQAAVAVCLARHGRIDILVNNVGGSAPGDPVSMLEEVWQAQMDLNLKTVFLACKYVLPVMQAQGRGVIVNIASVAGVRDQPGRQYIAYAASKAGVIRMSKAVAIDNARKGIRCNTVVPGLMNTPLVSERLARQIGGNDAEKLIAERHARVPIGQMGDGWDVAHAVLFLASDEAKHITATEIIVDGGLTATRP
ncbi:MAG: SDR family oxidoreductase [Acetobacteraceae bacterium]|nr:SDR family oxidoreductase [Acetobacteraceae bacterium]